MELREKRKKLRREFAPVGWTLVVYYLIMNVVTMGVLIFDVAVQAVMALLRRETIDEALLMERVVSNGWGYILTILVGMVILLCWKKPAFFRQKIFQRGKPMGMGNFLCLVCLFMSCQLLVQLLAIVMELVTNIFGLSIMDAMESATVSADTFSMFLYAGLGAPIAEEILFRGLILRTLEPYGKRFAVFVSALTFGIFHGNPVQAPYAFVVGLVLGYTAVEYNISWAMLLHMLNNLVLGDMLGRILAPLGTTWETIIVYALLIAFAIAAAVILICRRKEVAAYFKKEAKMDVWHVDSFFGTPSVIVFILMLCANGLFFILL